MWAPDPPRHTLGQLHRQLLVVGLVWFTRSATALLDDLFSHYFDYEIFIYRFRFMRITLSTQCPSAPAHNSMIQNETILTDLYLCIPGGSTI